MFSKDAFLATRKVSRDYACQNDTRNRKRIYTGYLKWKCPGVALNRDLTGFCIVSFYHSHSLSLSPFSLLRYLAFSPSVTLSHLGDAYAHSASPRFSSRWLLSHVNVSDDRISRKKGRKVDTRHRGELGCHRVKMSRVLFLTCPSTSA